ncbi:MAG: hypothetical protein AB8F94_27760 [Saprospiraceae bacterium]
MENPQLRLAFLFLLITLSIPTFAQKHSISLTPFRPLFKKFNLRYEYAIKNNLTIALEVEDWNIKNKPKFTLSDKKTDERTHLGNRFNLGIRKYDISKVKERSTSYSFIGIGSFIGKHEVGMNTFTRSTAMDDFVIRSGNISLLTTGVRADVGMRKIYKKGFFLEVGIFGGYAWNNKKQRKLLLYDEKQTSVPESKKLINNVNGLFFNALFLIGYNF